MTVAVYTARPKHSPWRVVIKQLSLSYVSKTSFSHNLLRLASQFIKRAFPILSAQSERSITSSLAEALLPPRRRRVARAGRCRETGELLIRFFAPSRRGSPMTRARRTSVAGPEAKQTSGNHGREKAVPPKDRSLIRKNCATVNDA